MQIRGTAQAQFRAKVRYKAEVVWTCAEERWCTYWKMLNVEGEIEADEKERKMFWIVQTI